MTRELKRSLGPTNLSVRLWTLRDKKTPMFRARNPDVHIVEVTAKSERHSVILLERTFEDYAKAKEWYSYFLGAFGQPMQIVKRKETASQT